MPRTLEEAFAQVKDTHSMGPLADDCEQYTQMHRVSSSGRNSCSGRDLSLMRVAGQIPFTRRMVYTARQTSGRTVLLCPVSTSGKKKTLVQHDMLVLPNSSMTQDRVLPLLRVVL